MNPSNYPNRSAARTSTISFPRNGNGSRYPTRDYYDATQTGSHFWERTVQRSRPIPIPSANPTSSGHLPNTPFFSPDPQANVYENRGRRHLRAQSLAGPPVHRQNQTSVPTPSSRAHFSLRASSTNDYAPGSNSSSDQSTNTSHGSSSSGIFPFSPPSSLEGHPTQHSSAHAPGPRRFLYTPPQTSQDTSQSVETELCQDCGHRVWSNARSVHAQVCEARGRTRRGRTSVAFSCGHYSSEQSSDIRWQERALESQQPQTIYPHPRFVNATDSMLGDPSHEHAHVANVVYVRGSPGHDMNPSTHPHANSLTYEPPFSSPDYNRLPYSHLP